MSILNHIPRASLLSLIALTGSAAAQDTPPSQDPVLDDPTTTTPDSPTPPPTGDMSGDMQGDTPLPRAADPSPVVPAAPPPAPAPVMYTEDAPPLPRSRTDANDEPGGPTLERFGVSVALGGGVEGFTNDTLRASTDPGALLNLRVAVGTRSPFAIEGAYIGSVQTIDVLGIDSNALLVGNGLEGKLRLNFLDESVQPFAFAGVGWRRYSLRNTDTNTSAVASDDDVLEVPFGAGIAYKIAGLQMDTRGEFRYATQEDLMPSLTPARGGDAAEMHRWSINTNIGYSF